MRHPIRHFGRVFIVLALLVSLGAHWAVLQSVAWTQMIFERSRAASFTEAVKTTFDGEHPCPMCQRIAAEKQKEQAPIKTEAKPKLDVYFRPQVFVILVPQAKWSFHTMEAVAESRAEPPLLTPPRAV